MSMVYDENFFRTQAKNVLNAELKRRGITRKELVKNYLK